MNPDDIQQHINDAVVAALKQHLPAAINTAVDASVNGKINSLRHDMQPLIDAYHGWLSTKRLAVTMVGLFISIGGLIAAGQAFYAFLTGHLTFK